MTLPSHSDHIPSHSMCSMHSANFLRDHGINVRCWISLSLIADYVRARISRRNQVQHHRLVNYLANRLFVPTRVLAHSLDDVYRNSRSGGATVRAQTTPTLASALSHSMAAPFSHLCLLKQAVTLCPRPNISDRGDTYRMTYWSEW